MPLRHAATSPPQLYDLLHQPAREQLRQPPGFPSGFRKTGSESVDAIMRGRRMALFAGFVARMGDTRLPNCVMFERVMWGAGCVGAQEKEWTGCLVNDLRAFGINAGQWTTVAQDDGGWRKTEEQGAERFMVSWITVEKANGWTTVCSCMCLNVTGWTK